MIEYRCEHCGSTMQSPSSMAGLKEDCPKCSCRMVVPLQRRKSSPFYSLSPDKQARMLGIGYEEIRLKSIRKNKRNLWLGPISNKYLPPEFAALEHFRNLGYLGCTWVVVDELIAGASVACTPSPKGNKNRDLAELNITYGAYQGDEPYDRLVKRISKLSEDRIIKGVTLYRKTRMKLLSENPPDEFSFESWIALCKRVMALLGRDRFHTIVQTQLLAKRCYKGWPDLTLVKGNELCFCEVKTTDSLHKSQYQVVTELARPLKLPFMILRILPEASDRVEGE